MNRDTIIIREIEGLKSRLCGFLGFGENHAVTVCTVSELNDYWHLAELIKKLIDISRIA